jgi:hypothetical protein
MPLFWVAASKVLAYSYSSLTFRSLAYRIAFDEGCRSDSNGLRSERASMRLCELTERKIVTLRVVFWQKNLPFSHFV